MALLIQYTLIFASVLMLVALGGCFSEHSGIINIGLEGIMGIGAMGGALMMRYLPDGTSAPVMIVMVCLAAVLAGAVYSMLLAVAAINFNADQTIIGTAMNMLGTAVATVIVKALNMMVNPDDVSSTIAYVDKTMYCAQVSDFISAIIIYLCGFDLFVKVAINKGIAKREEKKPAPNANDEGGKK